MICWTLNSPAYDPNAHILDVRTPAEWYWVGHPGKDKCGNGAFLEEPIRKVINIPWYLWEYVPQDKKHDRHIPNRFFDEEVVRQFGPAGPTRIIVRVQRAIAQRSEKIQATIWEQGRQVKQAYVEYHRTLYRRGYGELKGGTNEQKE